MAVEDGLALGVLLGRLNQCPELMQRCTRLQAIQDVLVLYEALRKSRTTVSVRGAISMQDFFHLEDGPDQVYRDSILEGYACSQTWPPDCRWNWGDGSYQRELLGFDVVEDANAAFDRWRKYRACSR